MTERLNEYGLTGGIGSGKSTVSQRLAEHGATIVDADLIVRDLQQPGSEVLSYMADILGSDIIAKDRSLNREVTREKFFDDDRKRIAIENMINPFIRREIARQIAEATPEYPTILDIPLLIENDKPIVPVQGIVVVDVPEALAIERLVKYRGYTPERAKSIIDKQLSRDERLSLADFIIDNTGTTKQLVRQADAAWSWMLTQY